MLLCKPVRHLVAHEDGELHFEFAFGLGEAAGDGHDGWRKDTLSGQGTHKRLEIRC